MSVITAPDCPRPLTQKGLNLNTAANAMASGQPKS